jgi:hypothetical protein
MVDLLWSEWHWGSFLAEQLLLLLSCITSDKLRALSVRESNAGGGEIFHTCPDRPWDLLNFVSN